MPNDIEELLCVMRKMNHAALQADWVELGTLDDQRYAILENFSQQTLTPTKECLEAIVELTQLDQVILNLTNQSLEQMASQVETTNRQSQACQHYLAFSSTGHSD